MGIRARRLGLLALTAVLGAGTVAAVSTSVSTVATASTVTAASTVSARAYEAMRVMPLGDSVTRGVGSPRMTSYRMDLDQRLIKGGLEIQYVGSQRDGTGTDARHEGHGGWTIDEMAARLDGWLATYQPDAILLHAGTNNIKIGDSASTTARKLSAMIDQIRTARPEAHIFVAKIIQSRVPREVRTDRAYNRLIPRLVAAKRDGGITVVDQSSVSGIDLHDLRHPNEFGYSKMAWNWYRAMSRVYGTAGYTGADPYRATRTWRCLGVGVVVDGKHQHQTECRTWVLRSNGAARPVRTWQTLREDEQTYRVRAKGGWATRTRVVKRWTGPGNLLNV